MDSEMPGMAKTVSQMFQKDPTEIPSKTKLAYAIDLEWKIVVPGAGLEPARCYQRGILNPLCLPISPPGHRVAFQQRCQA